MSPSSSTWISSSFFLVGSAEYFSLDRTRVHTAIRAQMRNMHQSLYRQSCEFSGYTGCAKTYALGAMSKELVGIEQEATGDSSAFVRANSLAQQPPTRSVRCMYSAAYTPADRSKGLPVAALLLNLQFPMDPTF
jgi:hypothetical protein